MSIKEQNLACRPRRLRQNFLVRDLVAETRLCASDLILPVFICDVKTGTESIASLPNIFRHSEASLLKLANEACKKNIRALALFPCLDSSLKSHDGAYALLNDGLVPRFIRLLKKEFPDLLLIADVALDPYTTHGHDGLLNKSQDVDNDLTLPLLAKQACVLADAGADIVAPSDMMDGRVACLRQALDEIQKTNTLILAYTAKYASAFYGPFREALGSATNLKSDKKTYQMDIANAKEALKEANLDEAEGADILMVKPALTNLDIIYRMQTQTLLPVFAYQVSGEYAMIHALAAEQQLNVTDAMRESLLCIKRAGAKCIFTYSALEMAAIL